MAGNPGNTSEILENDDFFNWHQAASTKVVRELAGHDLSDKLLIFMTGNSSAFRAHLAINATAFIETATSPYSSRVSADGSVSFWGIKKRLALNGIVHVPTAIMKMGWMETTDGDFYSYRQGMSLGVCSVIEALDKQMLAVAAV
ncbi:hypothetical protein MY10362_002930 [Beauveria mimosiformis]